MMLKFDYETWEGTSKDGERVEFWSSDFRADDVVRVMEWAYQKGKEEKGPLQPIAYWRAEDVGKLVWKDVSWKYQLVSDETGFERFVDHIAELANENRRLKQQVMELQEASTKKLLEERELRTWKEPLDDDERKAKRLLMHEKLEAQREEADCLQFEPGSPNGTCIGTGNYMCLKCKNKDGKASVWRSKEDAKV